MLLLVLLLGGCATGGPSDGGSTPPPPPASSPSASSTAATSTSAAPAAPAATSALPGPQPLPSQVAVIPTRVVIPAIGVDTSRLEALRREPGTGELAPPVDFNRAGYYVDGAVPGANGPAVIAAHVDDTTGPKVFYRLHELKPGDLVLVSRSDGRRITFRVDSVQQYPKDAFPTDAVYGPQPGASLRLITCGGSFDTSVRSYRDNIVVYASEIFGQ